MASKNAKYQVLPLPGSRQVVADAGRLGRRRNLVHGFVEFDVTAPRDHIRQHKVVTGETLSFTAFLVSCLAQSIETHSLLNSYRNWRGQLIAFEEVDVVTLIEPKAGAYAFPHIIRAANHKSFRQIHDEIRAIQSKPHQSQQHTGFIARWGQRVPGFIRALFYRALLRNPHWLKQTAGTVVITSVGMFLEGGGWGLGFAPFHTLTLTVGSIAEKPAVVRGQIAPREFLYLTLTLDHEIVDGAPAARFAQCFKNLVESGELLVPEHLANGKPG